MLPAARLLPQENPQVSPLSPVLEPYRLRRHVVPPSCDHPMRSLRAIMPRSCCHVPMRFRGCAGLTAIAGSISSPAMCVSSSAARGQPPANGLGPDTTRSCSPAPGPGLATAGDGLAVHTSPLAATANPAVRTTASSHTCPAQQSQKSGIGLFGTRPASTGSKTRRTVVALSGIVVVIGPPSFQPQPGQIAHRAPHPVCHLI
jgi:hypothetical protein